MNAPNTSLIIRGIGSYTPSRVLTNDDISQFVDTSDEWIRSRSGISERRIAADDESCSDMAVKAAREAIKMANLSPEDIDFLIVATMTPDTITPSTACLVQNKLGLRQIPSFDVGAACTGFIYILGIGGDMLQANSYRNALLIGAEKLSSILDWQDRSTCVLFGDGAGAAVLSRSDDTPGRGILGTYMEADGSDAAILNMPGGGSNCPATIDSVNDRMHYLKMAGREVFKAAVSVMEKSAREILGKFDLSADDIACVIPHQANLRIIDLLSTRLGINKDKFFVNLDRYGNTSAASVPLALDEAFRSGRIKSGDYVLLMAFGAGLTWATSLIKWQ